MRPLLLLLILVLVASCGCVDPDPAHGFKVNETREFECVVGWNFTYTGDLMWDGEHFHINADYQGYPVDLFGYGTVNGIDTDVTQTMFIPCSQYHHVWRHQDFRDRDLMKKMIKGSVPKS